MSRVSDAPICAGSTQERTQGATRGFPVTVKCTVEAEPARDISWSWVKIREDSTDEELIVGDIRSLGLSSSVSFVPLKQEDYGMILCRATNSVGTQKRACVVNLVPAGPPDPPSNCTATTSDPETLENGIHVKSKMSPGDVLEVSLSVTCLEGFDGGLPQYFQLEAWQDDQAIANVSSEFPEWVVAGVQTGVGVKLYITAHNARGSSYVVSMAVHTTSAQQHAAPGQKDTPEIAALLGAIAGGLCVLLILIIVAVFISKKQRPTKIKTITRVPVHSTTPIPTEDYDPDVVKSIQRILPSLDVLPSPQGQNRIHCHSRLSSVEDAERRDYSEDNSTKNEMLTTVNCKLEDLRRDSLDKGDGSICHCQETHQVENETDKLLQGEEDKSDAEEFDLTTYISIPCYQEKYVQDYKLLPTRETNDPSTTVHISSEQLCQESSPSSMCLERNSYACKPLSVPLNRQEYALLNCRKSTSLPRSKIWRSNNKTTNSGTPLGHLQRIPTSASTGHLSEISATTEENFSSTCATKVKGDPISTLNSHRHVRSNRSLKESAHAIAEAEIDLDITIPIGKPCGDNVNMMIMKLVEDFQERKTPSQKAPRQRSSPLAGYSTSFSEENNSQLMQLSTDSSIKKCHHSPRLLVGRHEATIDEITEQCIKVKRKDITLTNSSRENNATSPISVLENCLYSECLEENKCLNYVNIEKGRNKINAQNENYRFSTFHKESTV
ncbi:hypothetical protein SK128_007176 [Halocaridina rubra]|uniref:Ig-like domain-containing protein n=1 Tax=Halocaridina rubra TaxID=373956 RepID=A0AAN8XE42_HALRR